MTVSFQKATLLYLSGTMICTFLNLFGHVLDHWLGTHSLFAILCKLPPILFMLLIMVRLKNARILFGGKFFTPYLLFLLLPLIFSALVNTGHPNITPTLDILLLGIIGMLTTIVWEELFFHYVGQMLFERNDSYSIGALAVLVLGFGLSHLLYILLDPSMLEEVLWQTALTTSFGFFSLTLYAKVQNIWVSALAHLSMNVLNTFSTLFAEKPFFHEWRSVLDALYCLCLIIAGIVLYRLNREQKHLAPIHLHEHHIL